MKTVLLYIRVSTDEQAEKGYSQRSQEEQLLRFCELKGYQVTGIFREDHSAKTFERPEWKKILFYLAKHKGKTELILFIKWDRFSRNAPEAYQMINKLYRLGVEPQATEQPLDMEVPENKLMLAFYLAQPQVENDRRSLNTIAGLRRAQKEGLFMGKAPFGYTNRTRPDGSKYIDVVKPEAELVQWIFDKISTGNFSALSILNAAKERGFTKQEHAFWIMLRSPVYTGKVVIKQYKKEPAQMVKGRHDAVISEALFYQVQDVLDGNKKEQRPSLKSDPDFPLRGHVICKKCGRLLTASNTKGRSHYYPYYHCSSTCGTRFKAPLVHNAFANELKRYNLSPEILPLCKLVLADLYKQSRSQETDAIKKIKQEIEHLQHRKEKVLELLINDKFDADDYRNIKAECERKLIKAESQLVELTTGFTTTGVDILIHSALHAMCNLDALYNSADPEGKKNIAGSMFPENFEFDGEHVRTGRINEAARLIFNIGAGLRELKKGEKRVKNALLPCGSSAAHFSNLFYYDLKKLAAMAA